MSAVLFGGRERVAVWVSLVGGEVGRVKKEAGSSSLCLPAQGLSPDLLAGPGALHGPCVGASLPSCAVLSQLRCFSAWAEGSGPAPVLCPAGVSPSADPAAPGDPPPRVP